MGCYIWYSDDGTGRGCSLTRPLLAVPNVTAHPSTASVPIIVLMYNGPLSLKLVPFESLGAVSYSPSIVTVAVSAAAYEISSVKQWRDFENQVRGR